MLSFSLLLSLCHICGFFVIFLFFYFSIVSIFILFFYIFHSTFLTFRDDWPCSISLKEKTEKRDVELGTRHSKREFRNRRSLLLEWISLGRISPFENNRQRSIERWNVSNLSTVCIFHGSLWNFEILFFKVFVREIDKVTERTWAQLDSIGKISFIYRLLIKEKEKKMRQILYFWADDIFFLFFLRNASTWLSILSLVRGFSIRAEKLAWRAR